MRDDPTSDYEDKFGKRPDVTTVKLNKNNRTYYDMKVREAIQRGTPLTEEEEADIEYKTYKPFYDRLRAGERVLL